MACKCSALHIWKSKTNVPVCEELQRVSLDETNVDVPFKHVPVKFVSTRSSKSGCCVVSQGTETLNEHVIAVCISHAVILTKA